MNLKNKKIAITGGAGAIGSLLAKELLKLGAKPIIIDRSDAGNSSFDYIKGDLSSASGVSLIAEELKKRQIDVLINLAGIQYFGLIEKQDSENTILNYFVNLIAPVLLTQAILPEMKKRNSGHIVNIGSIFASINFAHFVTYSSSKAGLKAFSESLRRELNHTNIAVTYIAPRAVKTPLNKGKVLEFANKTKMNMDEPELVIKRIIKAIICRKKDVYIGFPECFFVRLNALFPRLVDQALAKNDAIARLIINS